MSDRRARYVILCEDRQHEVFVWRFLKGLVPGITRREVRVESRLGRGGSAEQFVRERYPRELKEFRRAFASMQAVLVVMTDCDKWSTAERRKQIEDYCAGQNVPPRAVGEPVALLLPKWNIETWIHFLADGASIDESKKDYPKFAGRESDCQPAVDRLHAIRAAGWALPANSPASLAASVPEWRRFA